MGGLAVGEGVRTVWFYRDYGRLTGGHLKHSHYFDHVRRMEGFAPQIAFDGTPPDEARVRERDRLWPTGERAAADHWAPGRRDLLFLAGVDWRYLKRSGLEHLPNPRINLIQHVRHAHESTELYGYLSERAVRICVSLEVADAIAATGRTTGPVFTIPNGIDVALCERSADCSSAGYEARSRAVTIAGYKRPDLARGLSERLHTAHIDHRLHTDFLERDTFLALLGESRVMVCLPHALEGFYLPALEAMASGALVVTLDCVGNRGFCHDHWNCVIAEPNAQSLGRAVHRTLTMTPAERGRMHLRARETAARYSLAAERQRFHAILGDIDRLWRAA